MLHLDFVEVILYVYFGIIVLQTCLYEHIYVSMLDATIYTYYTPSAYARCYTLHAIYNIPEPNISSQVSILHSQDETQ